MDNIQRSELLFKAADECLSHAEGSFGRKAWNMAIRRAQEAVELELTAILALIGIHYPKDHDQAPLAMRVLKANGYDLNEDAQKVELISLDLSRKRGPALHQEDGYDEQTAIKALDGAKFVKDKIEKIRLAILLRLKK